MHRRQTLLIQTYRWPSANMCHLSSTSYALSHWYIILQIRMQYLKVNTSVHVDVVNIICFHNIAKDQSVTLAHAPMYTTFCPPPVDIAFVLSKCIVCLPYPRHLIVIMTLYITCAYIQVHYKWLCPHVPQSEYMYVPCAFVFIDCVCRFHCTLHVCLSLYIPLALSLFITVSPEKCLCPAL